MKLFDKMKRFYLKKQTNGGFTLVELIVVIAILAILAGIAVPAYSGYVEKAERANDEALLKTVNEAYASACAVNGDDIWLVGQGVAKIEDDGTIAYVAKANRGDAYGEAFNSFFAGNENTKFELIERIVFDPYVAKFVDENDVTTLTVSFNGKEYTIKQTSVDDFKAAVVFSENIEEMQGQVNTLSDAFGAIVGSRGTASIFGEKFVQYLDDNEISNEDIGNAAVLYVAQNASDLSAEDVATTFANAANYMRNNPDATIVEVLLNSSDDPLTGAALMYGSITAYSAQPGNEALNTQASGVTDGASLLKLFQDVSMDQNFVNYVGTMKQDGSGGVNISDQFNTDMKGFLGAMDAIDTVSPGIQVTEDDVWSSDEVNELMNLILSNNK